MSIGNNCKSIMEIEGTSIKFQALKIISAVKIDRQPITQNDGTFSFIKNTYRPYEKLFNYSEDEVIFPLEIVGRKVT
jgi:hypothetical protein